jgi:hypothetical protein
MFDNDYMNEYMHECMKKVHEWGKNYVGGKKINFGIKKN